MEIRANEDIIQMMIRSGIPDVPLPPELELQITVEKGKTGTQTGSKSPRTRSQAATEGDDKKAEGGASRQGRKLSKSTKWAEPTEEEGKKAKNCSDRQQKQDEGQMEGEKAKNCQKQPKADTLDLFALPDFLEDDDDDDNYEPPVKRNKRRKAVPLPPDDDDEEDKDNGDEDNEEQDKDYEEGDDDEDENGDKDKEITLQVGKADQRKRKGQVIEVGIKERKTGQ